MQEMENLPKIDQKYPVIIQQGRREKSAKMDNLLQNHMPLSTNDE